MGKVYVGGNYTLVNGVFSTVQKTTAIVLDTAQGSKDELTESHYDVKASSTIKPWQPEFSSGEAKGGQVENYQALLKGNYYTDNMCLYQNEFGERNEKTGHLCVKNQRFLAVDEILGSLDQNAIIGLGPIESDYDDLSYIHSLYN